MATVKTGDYKVFNGTDYDTIHFKSDANLINIADAGNIIDAGNVEGALQEIKTQANTNGTNITNHMADNSKQVPHLGTTTNSGDAYTITTSEVISTNQKFTIKFNAASTTAPTLKINTGTAYAVKKANGNNAKLYASVYTLFFDGSAFTVLGEGGEYGTAGQAQTLEGYTLGTETGVVSGTMANLAGTSLGNGTPTNGVQGASKFDFDILLPSSGYVTTATKVHQTLTNLISANLVSGVTIPEIGVTGSATIQSLGGKRYATGTVISDGSGNITISGLAFQPSIIQLYANISSTWCDYIAIRINPSISASTCYRYTGAGAPYTYSCSFTSNGFTASLQDTGVTFTYYTWE